MLNSMTGFARDTADTPFGTITCELRAVNHRYLDVQFRLPEELRSKEIELRSRIGEAVKRGKVECSIYLKRGKRDGGDCQIAHPLESSRPTTGHARPPGWRTIARNR